MATPIDIMKSDYMTMENITTRLKADGVQEYLKFKDNGDYEFLECENCDGPMLGHQVAKCRHSEVYAEKTLAKFKKWLDKIPELRRQIEERDREIVDRTARSQAEMMSRALRDAAETRGTTQLVKARQPPVWTGQKFEKWRTEVERWDENNKATVEDKFMDVVESLKKNEAIREFVVKSLLEKVGEERTVERILIVMAEKYSKTTCEQVKDTMTKMCVSRLSGAVDSLIDEFNEMTLEMASLDMLTPRMEYAISAEFVEKLEESGKINATEKLRLKDILEEPDGQPRRGDTRELMIRELKRLKVADNRDEPFAQQSTRETPTNYVTNDKRSRFDDWRSRLQSRGYKRSESRPGYFRTASRGEYVRDSSKFGDRSPSRPSLRPYRDGSWKRSLSRGKSPASGTRNRERSTDKPKSDLVKKVEGLERETKEIKKCIGGIPRIEEMLKKATINALCVENEILIDGEYAQKGMEKNMVIDSGAPVSLVSSIWLKNYAKEAEVGDERIRKASSNRRFRLGKTPYISKEKVTFPVVMKADDDDQIKQEVTAHVIESDEVNFLCGEETLQKWRTVLDFEDKKIRFKGIEKRVKIDKQGHLVVKLQRGETRKEDETVFLVAEEKAPKICQTDEPNKKSPPAASFKRVGEKEKNAEENEKENSEEIVIAAIEVPTIERREKPVVETKTTEERITAEIRHVPHEKLGVEELSERGRLRPAPIKSEDNWNGLWEKLRKMMAKTEEVETRIKKAQRKLSSLKDSIKGSEITIDVPPGELAVTPPKDRLGVKAPDPRKRVSPCEEKVKENPREPGKVANSELEEKEELDGQKQEDSLIGTKRFPEIITIETKRTLDVARIEDGDAKSIKGTDTRKEKTSKPPEKEEKETPRKTIKDSSRRIANSGPGLAMHTPILAKERKGGEETRKDTTIGREDKVEKDINRDGRKEGLSRKEAGSGKKELDEQKCEDSMVSMKRVPETATEEIKRTLDVGRIENEDVKDIGDTERREDKASDPPKDEKKKTPRKQNGTLGRLAAEPRPELAGHGLNVARKQEGRKLKDKKEKTRRSAIEKSEKNRIKFEEIGRKEDRHTEEDRDPPDKV